LGNPAKRIVGGKVLYCHKKERKFPVGTGGQYGKGSSGAPVGKTGDNG